MEISAVRWNVVSEITKVLLNGVFAKIDGSRQWIENIMTDRFRSWWIASSTTYQQKLHQSGKSSFK